MTLMSLLTGRTTEHETVQMTCSPACVNLGAPEHTRHHLLEDLAKAIKESDRHHRTVSSRFAVFELTCSTAIRDDLTRCSHDESSLKIVSSTDISDTMDIIRELIKECPTVHLGAIRDIYSEQPRNAFITYEVRPEPGSRLPSN